MAYSCWQIAEFLGVRTTTITRFAREGKLKGRKDPKDNCWKFQKEDIAYFLLWHQGHRNHLARFFTYKPTAVSKLSYDILKKEVQRQLKDYA